MSERRENTVVLADQALAEANDVIELTVSEAGLATADEFQADLDAGDFCAAFVAGLANVAITTSETVEKWLSAIHDAASGKPGDYGPIQKALSAAFYHKGDALDVYSPGGGFVGRNGEKAYVAFHRLLFGHDILAAGEGFMPYNPFKLMYSQEGVRGILQAMRHLVADTMSKQGLPLPGSSFLDTAHDGRPWNQIIDWVQELSTEAFGNKAEAQSIYSHLFTIRMQDVAGVGLVTAMLKAYEKGRGVSDSVRVAQLELLGVSIAFFGQAVVGAVKQKGVPYVNNAMIPQLAAAYVALLRSSGMRTVELHRETKRLLHGTNHLAEEHAALSDVARIAAPADEDPRLIESFVNDLVGFLEGGKDVDSR